MARKTSKRHTSVFRVSGNPEMGVGYTQEWCGDIFNRINKIYSITNDFPMIYGNVLESIDFCLLYFYLLILPYAFNTVGIKSAHTTVEMPVYLFICCKVIVIIIEHKKLFSELFSTFNVTCTIQQQKQI